MTSYGLNEQRELVAQLGVSVDDFKKRWEGSVTALTHRVENAEENMREIMARQNRLALSPGGGAFVDDEHIKARTFLGEFARRATPGTLAEEVKGMFTGSDPDGGYVVLPWFSEELTKTIFETSPVRQVARVRMITSDTFEEIVDKDQADASWAAETAARPSTAAPQLAKLRIPVHEIYAMPEATQSLLDDAAFSIEDWLTEKIADRIARKENAAFVAGNGVGQPRGFTTYTTAATADASRAWGVLEHVATGTSGGFGTAPNGTDKMIDLVHSLKAGYRAGASWMMNRTSAGAVRKLKDSEGRYIWQDRMQAGQPDRLLGYPVVEAEDMPTYTTADSLAIAFGNFEAGYTIVDRSGIRMLRDPFTNKPYVRFYTHKRVGGDVANFEAIKLLKFGAT